MIFRKSRDAGLLSLACWVYSPGPDPLEGPLRRGGRVAEGARLESVYTGDRIAGSNPAPSAILSQYRSGRTIWMLESPISGLTQLRTPIQLFVSSAAVITCETKSVPEDLVMVSA